MKKILAIDDQQDNLITIKAVLKNNVSDCKVITALSGEEGIKVAKKEKPDVILLDIIMPQMDGYEVCKRLKANKLTKHIPVIMITAIKTDTDSRVKGLETGADAFLSKPIDSTELSAQIGVMLRIKEAEDKLRAEKEILEETVFERTKELVKTNKELKNEILVRKKANEALHQYENIVSSSTDMLALLDKEYKHLSANESYAKAFNLTSDLLIGKTVAEIFGDDFFNNVIKLYADRCLGGEKISYEEWFEFPALGRVFMNVSYYPYLNAANNIMGFVVNGRDITEYKQAGEKIRKLSSAVEQSPSVIVITDLQGRIEYVNPKYTDLTGYTSKEILGKKASIMKSGTQTTDFYNEMWELISSGKSWRGEFHNVKKNGELLWEAASVSPIFNKDGEITNFIKVAEDITERKLAEEKLLESQERNKILLETTSVGLVLCKVDGSIIDANQAYADIIGYSINEVKKLTYWEITPEKYAKEEGVQTELLNTIGKYGPYEKEYIHKNGHLVPVRLIGSIIKMGNEQFIWSSVIDITEQKLEEKILDVELKLFEYAINHSEEELLQKFLDEAEKLTNSEIGFYHYIADDQESISLQTWSSNTLNNMCKGSEEMTSHYSISEAGVWVDCVKERKPVIHNDYSSLLHKKGLLEGHAPIMRELVVPVIRGKQIMAVLGVGNKKSNYNEADVKTIQRLADIAWETVVRKQAEKELKESESRFKALHNASFGGIAIHDMGIIKDCNQGLTNITGYSNNELIGMDGFLLIAKDYRETVINNIKASFEKAYEVVGIRKNGEKYPLRLEARMIPYEGKDLRVVEFRDITEQKKAEKTLIESEERYRSLVVNLPVGIFRSTLAGKVVSANPAMAKIYGYDSVEELLNVAAEDYYTPKSPRKKMLMELKDKGFLLGYETWENTKNGSLIWVSVNYKATFDENGDISFIDGVVIDITERKLTEQELQKALHKATESDRLKSAFLATISHELRTPLNAIIGFSDIISDELPIEDILSFNKNINSSGYHLLRIVEDLFDITLIETGQTKIKLDDVNVYSLLNDVQEIILIEQLNTNKDQLEIKRKVYPDNEELIIHTDPSKLKQVLINLLKNALKFTHEGFISYGFEVETIHKKSMLKFYVKDTGIGIPKNMQELIFDVFRQVEDSHTRVYGGTGIGLSISKKITELLGGEIWLESEEGKGSTFYFTIPLIGMDDSEELVADIEIESEIKQDILEKKTILIVEDVEESIELLKILIEGSGYKALKAKNGQEAVNQCKENSSIDLVLMDVNMPIMNGYEATGEIKKFRPKLPIISQTAYATLGDKEKSLDAGFDDYISKPIKRDELIAKIEKYLGLRIYI